MANAKKCDICGKYFSVPEFDPRRLEYEDTLNLIRLHKAVDPNNRIYGDDFWITFDACDECYQNLLDYILGSAAESAESIAE